MAAVMATGEGSIYSATYSNVPVYEFKVGGDGIMRRRVDDWVNATHILKAAGLDKPSRTRILEREVQKGVHEKIQGGYGKYQGTWIPLADGRVLADRNGVLRRLQPIFDFTPGDKSPPPAPKHTNAASSRPRAQKLAAANKKPPPMFRQDTEPASSFMSVNHQRTPSMSQSFGYDQHQYGSSMHQQSYNDEDESLAQASVDSSSMIADDDNMIPGSSHSRKRKRGTQDTSLSIIEQNHIVYGDQLLDYFMTVGDAPTAARVQPPNPPLHFQVDRAIDDQGNTALHWACAMGDLEIVKDLIHRGADIHCLSSHDETPLVRAVLFTNNYEKRTMQELAELLKPTIPFRDWFGATVFNHLATTTRSKGKWKSSRYYAQVLIDKLSGMYPHHEVTLLLSSQDSNGDTAALTAAKNGCHKLATSLLSHCPEAGDLQNKQGETANDVLMEISRQVQDQAVNTKQHTRSQLQQKPGDEADLGNHDHPNNQLPPIDSDVLVSPPHPPQQQSRSSSVTAALLQRVTSIMEEANRRLARAYGEAKTTTPSQLPAAVDGIEGEEENGAAPAAESMNIDDDPKGVWTHIEAEREALQKQIETLRNREDTGEGLDTMVARYSSIRQDYESLVEQIQRSELNNQFKQHGSTTATVNGGGPDTSSSSSSSQNTPESKYNLTRTLTSLQSTRQHLVRELIHQRANTAASARMDVHRKLVALATGLPEGDLDPMAAALADSLEFERASQNQTQGRSRRQSQVQGSGRVEGEIDGDHAGVNNNGLGIDVGHHPRIGAVDGPDGDGAA